MKNFIISIISMLYCVPFFSQVDVGATVLVNPVSPICGNPLQPITVTIFNYSLSTINFVTDNITVNVSITGASIQTFNSPVINTGSLASGASMNVLVTPSCNLSAIGVHTFNATTVNFSDVNPFNNFLPVTNITVTDVPSPSIAGMDQTYCIPNGNLSGNVPTVGTGVWSLISGSGVVTVPGMSNSTITGLGVGPNIFRWTISNPPCPDSFSDVTITGETLPTISLISAFGTDLQNVCVNVGINTISYAIGGSATGATVGGLPPGVTGTFAAGMFNITGIPTVTGVYNYTVTTTGSLCLSVIQNGTITVNPDATIVLMSAVGTDAQTACQNTPISPIVYAIGAGGTGGTVSGLPVGVSGTFFAGSFTISGASAIPGLYNYTVTTTGTCAQVIANGFIVISQDATIALTSAVGTDAQTVCQNTPIANIKYTIGGGGTGATVSGLPTGVSGSFVGGVITLSGVPTVAGVFVYTVNTTGTCVQTSAAGTITVNPDAIISLSSAVGSDNQSICQNNLIIPITYAISGGGTGASVSGLPIGVTGTFVFGVFTISGTPTIVGVYNYTVTTSGTCAQVVANGTITVNSDAIISLASAVGSDIQSVCQNIAIINISYAIGGGGSGATVAGLPVGISGSFAAGVLTISGSTAVVGTFNYTVTTTGSCVQTTANGTISIVLAGSALLSSAVGTDGQSICVNTPISNIITYNIGGSATGATIVGLPMGVSGVYAAGVFTISGTPSVIGLFNYTITTTGGTCIPAVASGFINSVTQTIMLTSLPFTNDQSICETSSISNIVYQAGGSATGANVAGLPSGLITSFVGGFLTISGTPTETGTFFFTVTTTGACMPVSTIGSLKINPFIVGNTSGSNISICENSGGTLVSGPISGGSGIYSYLWEYSTTSGGVLSPAIGINNGVNYYMDADLYVNSVLYFKRTVSSGGCIDVTVIESIVTIDSLPTVVGTGSASLCAGEVALVSGITSSFGSINWTSNGLGVITNGTTVSPTYTSTMAEEGNTVVLTMTVNSANMCAPSQVTTLFTLDVNPLPVAISGGTATICPNGDEVTVLGVSASNGTLSWSHDGAGILVDTLGVFPTYTSSMLDAGDTVNLQLIVTGSPSCIVPQYDTAYYTVIVSSTGTAFVNAGADVTISAGNSIDLNANGAAIINWNWSPSIGLSDMTIPNPTANPTGSTTYVLTGTDINGCIAVDSMRITVDLDMNVVIANILTPNADSKNDTWIIENIEFYPNSEVMIVNREGQLVYESSNYDNSWGGTHDGKLLPDATYYYVLKFQGSDKSYKGPVTILHK
jgi:gliding motility-associated-like protein